MTGEIALDGMFLDLYRLTEQRKRMGHGADDEEKIVEKEMAMNQVVDGIEARLQELKAEAHRQVTASTS